MSVEDLTLYDLAFLGGGAKRAARTAMEKLLNESVLFVTPQLLIAAAETAESEQPLESEIISGSFFAQVPKQLIETISTGPALDEMVDRLTELGCVERTTRGRFLRRSKTETTSAGQQVLEQCRGVTSQSHDAGTLDPSWAIALFGDRSDWQDRERDVLRQGQDARQRDIMLLSAASLFAPDSQPF